MEKKHKAYLKLNIMSLFFLGVSFISVTLAWFAYSGLVNGNMNVDIKAWHIEFNGESKASNEISIPLTNIYPGMDTVTESVTIKNKGDSDAKLSYTIDSVRILNDDLTVYEEYGIVEDQLSNKYPFNIDISLSKEYLDASVGEATLDLSVSWPLDSDTDEFDSSWGNKTYEFQKNENILASKSDDYNARSSIKVVISIIAEQNMDKFTLNTGNMVLYDPAVNERCDSIGGTCYKTNMISPYYEDEGNVLLLPNILNTYGNDTFYNYDKVISDIRLGWASDSSALELKDLMKLVTTDVYDTLLIREGLSDAIVGYVTHENRFESYINEKVIGNHKDVPYNGYITFNSNRFNYLDTNKCYWINMEYDENRAFALAKVSDGVMKIYPENKGTSCNIVPLISVPREKLYSTN